MNPYARDHYRLRTELDTCVCRDRLRSHLVTWRRLDEWLPFGPSPRGRPVHGSVTSGGFALKKFIRYHNSGQTVATGRFLPYAGGTDILVWMGADRWFLAF